MAKQCVFHKERTGFICIIWMSTKLPRTLEVIGQGRARNHKPDVCGFPYPFQVKARMLI